MPFLQRALAFAVVVLCPAPLISQNVPQQAGKVDMAAYDTRGSGLPANAASTLLNFTLEADSTGENVFHAVTSDPGVIVSLILPSGQEITSVNATSFGFTYTVLADNPEADANSVLAIPGAHTLIQVPAGQISGVYSIKANAASVNTASAIIASYYSSSNVRAAVTMNATGYKVGDTVVLSGILFDGTTPITGATVTVGVSVPFSLASQTSVGGYQLVSQQSVGGGLTEYEYTFVLTNTGGAVQEVQAELASPPQNVSVVSGILLFGDIGAASTTTSLTRLVIQRDPASTFDPAALQWVVTATGPVVNVSLLDSGALDAAAGDGVYTGTFTPSTAGTYTVFLSATGTSLAGNSFSRNAVSSFDVSQQQLASLTGFSDAAQAGGIGITANVNVVTPGTYRFSMDLRASNQRTTRRSAAVTLSAGSQQVALAFSRADIFQLAVNGPYQRVNALLTFVGNSKELIAAAVPDAGPTAAYTLSSFAPPVSFTGQNAAAGVITSGGSTFGLLRVTIGVSNASSRVCDWSATLTDLSGNAIDFRAASGTVAAGTTSVTLDFNGNKIARSVNGPYLVTGAGIRCETAAGSIDQASATTLFQTQSFAASQFTSVTADFAMAITSTPPGAAPGSSFSFGVGGTSIGAFGGLINLSVSGLPTGVSGVFTAPSLLGSGVSTLIVSTTAGTPSGIHVLTITGTSGSVSHPVSGFLVVAGATPTPPSPVSLTPSAGSGATQSFTAVFADSNGGTNVKDTFVMFSGSTVFTESCVIHYSRITGVFSLVSDDGTGFLGPISPGSGSATNRQCSLNGTGSSWTTNGTQLTMTLNLTFNSNYFGGSKTSYMWAEDDQVQNSGWVQQGTWTVPSGQTIAISPGSLIMLTGSQSVSFSSAPTGAVFTKLPSGSVCGTLTTNVFTAPSTVTEPCWAEVRATSGSIWATTAIYLSPSLPEPAPTYIDPSNGVGSRKLFEFAVSDSQGLSHVDVIATLFLAPDQTPKCVAYYSPANNLVYLDGATQPWTALGSNGTTVSNQVCTIYGTTSSFQSGSSPFKLRLDIEFAPAEAGLPKVQVLGSSAPSSPANLQALGWWVP